jgi:hypothetical protein
MSVSTGSDLRCPATRAFAGHHTLGSVAAMDSPPLTHRTGRRPSARRLFPPPASRLPTECPGPRPGLRSVTSGRRQIRIPSRPVYLPRRRIRRTSASTVAGSTMPTSARRCSLRTTISASRASRHLRHRLVIHIDFFASSFASACSAASTPTAGPVADELRDDPIEDDEVRRAFTGPGLVDGLASTIDDRPESVPVHDRHVRDPVVS